MFRFWILPNQPSNIPYALLLTKYSPWGVSMGRISTKLNVPSSIWRDRLIVDSFWIIACLNNVLNFWILTLVLWQCFSSVFDAMESEEAKVERFFLSVYSKSEQCQIFDFTQSYLWSFNFYTSYHNIKYLFALCDIQYLLIILNIFIFHQ